MSRIVGRTARVALLGAALLVALRATACKPRGGPELTCKVNGVCFVCPDEKAQARCSVDPSSSRCKYAEPGHCKP